MVPIDTMSDLGPSQKTAGKKDKKDKKDEKEPAVKAKAKATTKAKAKAKSTPMNSAPMKKTKTPTTPSAPKKKAPKDDEEKDEEPPKKVKKKTVAPVKNHTLKRPAAAKSKVEKEKKDTPKGSGIKRPAAKNEESQEKNKKKQKTDLFKPLQAAKAKGGKDAKDVGAEEQGEEEEEEEDFENDEEIEFQVEAVDTKTDRCKKQKFMSMLAGKQLPDFLVQEWEKTTKMKVGRVEAQRDIINSCFNRGDMGKLMLALEKPFFQTMKEQWSERTASHTEKSLSPETFKEGLEQGDFIEVTDQQGKVAYCWSTPEHKTTKGDKSSFEMSATAEGSKGDALRMNNLTSGWKMGLFSKHATGAIPAAGKRSATLALEDRKQELNDQQWQAAQEQLQPGMQAFL